MSFEQASKAASFRSSTRPALDFITGSKDMFAQLEKQTRKVFLLYCNSSQESALVQWACNKFVDGCGFATAAQKDWLMAIAHKKVHQNISQWKSKFISAFRVSTI